MTADVAQAGVQVNIEDEMRQSYLDYAMSVIIGRALPDVRDGLKPVQRRILYAMFNEGLVSTRKTSKCAGVVGSVLKYFHPHGDSAVYDALVRLAQPWNLRTTLIDGQGNFGSIDGDPPAAYRYTECRLTAAAERLLQDIEQNTIDFIANFDDTTKEPVVLPSLWPNLVVNGSDGIAVGMATHIPPHNLGEVIDGVVALIRDPNLPLDKLMEYVPGPDFPTGGVIHGRQLIRQAYESGRGVLKLSAKTDWETIKRKNREVDALVVTEIPYQINKARLIERIAALVNEKTIDGISEIRDESDRSGMRIVVELRRDATRDVVLNQLLKLTPLRSSFGVINLAIVDGKPVVCPLRELLQHFIDHRRSVVARRTEFLLGKAQERMHILEGYRIALLNLDEVIQLIKQSESPKEARTGLSERFGLSEVQSQAILDLRLQKLTGLERLAVEQEHADLQKEIERLQGLLADSGKMDRLITDELREVREKFGDPRRTQIEDDDTNDFDMLDLIEDEEMVLTISHCGYVKRTPAVDFRAQRRGGRGVTGASFKEDDFVEHLFVASTHSDLLIFTSTGRMYWLKVYEIPEAARAARGRALPNLLQLREDEKITAVVAAREFREDRFILMASRCGVVKKTNVMEFSRPRRGGVIACTLDEGDTMIDARITTGSDDIILSTREGMAIRFNETDVRPMGRSARGVIGIRLDPGDEVVGMDLISNDPAAVKDDYRKVDPSATLLTVCENGFGKRSELADYRLQTRGGKGVIDIQTGDRNGPVVGVCAVNNQFGFMIITSAGKVIRLYAKDVSVIGRNTKGVRLINLEEGEQVVALARIVEEED